jgi:hypothetical protein
MIQERAVSKNSSADDCAEFSNNLLSIAERELEAFAHAVSKLFGAARVRQSVEDWVAELEFMEWPEQAIPDWRQVTVAAATRLAERLDLPGWKTPGLLLAIQKRTKPMELSLVTIHSGD